MGRKRKQQRESSITHEEPQVEQNSGNEEQEQPDIQPIHDDANDGASAAIPAKRRKTDAVMTPPSPEIGTEADETHQEVPSVEELPTTQEQEDPQVDHDGQAQDVQDTVEEPAAHQSDDSFQEQEQTHSSTRIANDPITAEIEMDEHGQDLTPVTTPYGVAQKTQVVVNAFWNDQREKLLQGQINYDRAEIPLARIKRVMKTDDEVKGMLINSEVPAMFNKVSEWFLMELTLRAFVHAQEKKRMTVKACDISSAVSKVDMYDFLIDIIPRDETQPPAPIPHPEVNPEESSPTIVSKKPQDPAIFPFMPNPFTGMSASETENYINLFRIQKGEEDGEGQDHTEERGEEQYQDGEVMQEVD